MSNIIQGEYVTISVNRDITELDKKALEIFTKLLDDAFTLVPNDSARVICWDTMMVGLSASFDVMKKKIEKII